MVSVGLKTLVVASLMNFPVQWPLRPVKKLSLSCMIAMEKDFGSLWLILSDFISNIGYLSLLIVSVILL